MDLNGALHPQHFDQDRLKGADEDATDLQKPDAQTLWESMERLMVDFDDQAKMEEL